MLQINQYKKTCYLTRQEAIKLSEFFTTMFDVEQIQTINFYMDGGDNICEIVGLEKEVTRRLGD